MLGSDLEKWRRLTNAATKGPWYAESHSHLESGCRCGSCYVVAGWTVTTNESIWCCDTAAIIDAVALANSLDKQQDYCTAEVLPYHDAEFAATARTAMPLLLDAVEKVLAIHSMYVYTDPRRGETYERCRSCGMEYPCDTARAALGIV